MITQEMLDRILAEREKAHQQEIARLEAEFKARPLEARLSAIERKIEEDEKEEPEQGIGGFKLTDIVQAYSMYQQMNGGKQ